MTGGKKETVEEFGKIADLCDRTFIECNFTKTATKEILFWVFSDSYETKTTRKFNCTILFIHHYSHSNKLTEKSISLKEFIPKDEHRYTEDTK